MPRRPPPRPDTLVSRAWAELGPRMLYVDPSVSLPAVIARAILLVVLALMSWAWLFQPLDGGTQIAPSFAHGIVGMANTVFHEAGHILFSFLGRLLMSFAGSAFQVAIPLICTVAFLMRQHLDPFGAAATTWWMGVNFIDVAPYINDASVQRLILLGGVTGRDVPGYHDWNYVLSRLGLLSYDQTIAMASHLVGAVFILGALVWASWLVWQQYSFARD